MNDEQILELIVRRRRQVVVNSCIYYVHGKGIISDKQFDKWAYELAALQIKYPKLSMFGEWSFEFRGFDGTSGYDLPIYGSEVNLKAMQLIDYAEKKRLLM